jgi:hypothetical protein
MIFFSFLFFLSTFSFVFISFISFVLLPFLFYLAWRVAGVIATDPPTNLKRYDRLAFSLALPLLPPPLPSGGERLICKSFFFSSFAYSRREQRKRRRTDSLRRGASF